MPFDIYQQIFDTDGQPLEQKARTYQNELINLFNQSPEAQALRDDSLNGHWIHLLLDFGQNYFAVTPAQMSAGNLYEILFDLIPRKVSASPDDAPEIVHEFQAFWQFLQREFHLANAVECLSALNDKTIRQMKKKMGNSDNFGIAKSFMMSGLERGFDMQTEEGIHEWMKTYNAELAAGIGTPIKFPSERSPMSREELASRIHIIGAPEESHQIKELHKSSAQSYTPPLDKLLTCTDIEDADPFPETSYTEQFGLGPEHIPELIRMATDEYLRSDDANEFESSAPFHAIRALAELHAEAAIEPLLAFSDQASREDQEWILETLVGFHLTMGTASLPALEQFLTDPSHDKYAQNYAAEIIGRIPQQHPEARTECIAATTRRLADFELNRPELNESLVRALLRMKAVEAAPLIQAAYTSGRVDDFWGGNWDEAQYELGLKERPLEEETPIYPASHKSTRKAPASKKAKSKLAKASRKANRKRR